MPCGGVGGWNSLGTESVAGVVGEWVDSLGIE